MHLPMHLQSLSCKIWNKVGKPTLFHILQLKLCK